MSSLQQRINWLLDDRKRTVSDVARGAGVNRKTISNWKSGRRGAERKGRGATSCALEKVAHELGNVDSEWLRTGEGSEPIGWDEPTNVATEYATANQRMALVRRFSGSLNPLDAFEFICIVDSLLRQAEEEFADARRLAETPVEFKKAISTKGHEVPENEKEAKPPDGGDETEIADQVDVHPSVHPSTVIPDPEEMARKKFATFLNIRNQILDNAGGFDKLSDAARRYQNAWYDAIKKATKAGAIDPSEWQGPSLSMPELDEEEEEIRAYPAIDPE